MLTHTKISCCAKGCYAVITLHPDDERQLRRTHETFYCPAGHGQSFTGKTEEEKRADKWERIARDWQDQATERIETVQALRDGLRVCPFGCGWHSNRRLPWRPDESDIARFFDRVWFDMAEHLQRHHGAAPTTRKQIPAKTGEAR